MDKTVADVSSAGHALRAAGLAAFGAMALMPDSAEAIMVVTKHNDTVQDGESGRYDVNRDGYDDVEIRVSKNGSFADIKTRQYGYEGKFGSSVNVKVETAATGGFLIDDRSLSPSNGIPVRLNSFVAVLQEGDTVDADTFRRNSPTSKSDLYDTLRPDCDMYPSKPDAISPNGMICDLEVGGGIQIGPFAEVGASGFVPLRFTTTIGCDELRIADVYGCDPEEFVNYGWLQLTRGSIMAGISGHQTTANAGAPIVPVPAPIALLATGALGLAALRRRRKAAA